MSLIIQRQGAAGTNFGPTSTALERYKLGRDAATAWIHQLQVNGIPTKADWMEFSERICFYAERYLAECDSDEPTSIVVQATDDEFRRSHELSHPVSASGLFGRFAGGRR